jgi:hypothetical protein
MSAAPGGKFEHEYHEIQFVARIGSKKDTGTTGIYVFTIAIGYSL